MKIKITFVLLLILTLIGCSSKVGVKPVVSSEQDIETTDNESTDEEAPVFHITREQMNNMEIETVGQLMMIMSAKLPIPEGETTYQTFVMQIEQTENEIVEDKGDSILVQSYKKNDETGKPEPAFQSIYFFKDGLLTRGPVLVDPENINAPELTIK